MTFQCLNFIGPPCACPRQAPVLVPVGKAEAGTKKVSTFAALSEKCFARALVTILRQLHVAATVIVDVLLAFIIVQSLIDNCPDRVKFAWNFSDSPSPGFIPNCELGILGKALVLTQIAMGQVLAMVKLDPSQHHHSCCNVVFSPK